MQKEWQAMRLFFTVASEMRDCKSIIQLLIRIMISPTSLLVTNWLKCQLKCIIWSCLCEMLFLDYTKALNLKVIWVLVHITKSQAWAALSVIIQLDLRELCMQDLWACTLTMVNQILRDSKRIERLTIYLSSCKHRNAGGK